MEILSVDQRMDQEEGPINRTTISVSMASGLVDRMEEYVKDGPKQVHGSVDDFVDFAIRDKLEQLDRQGKSLNFSEFRELSFKSDSEYLSFDFEDIREAIREYVEGALESFNETFMPALSKIITDDLKYCLTFSDKPRKETRLVFRDTPCADELVWKVLDPRCKAIGKAAADLNKVVEEKR